MSKPKPPAHMRRAKLAKRAQLLLVLASVGFAIYRLAGLLLGTTNPLQ